MKSLTRVSRVAVMVILAVTAACGGGRSSPAAPSAQPASSMTSGFGTLSIETVARCFQFAGDPACFSGARVLAQGVTSAVGAPSAPSGLTASASGSTVTLTWLAPTGTDPATSYIIEAGSAPGLANLANFSTGTSATSFTAGGVPAGSYYVRVRASNSSGASAPSNEVLLVVGGGPGGCTAAPGAPSGLTIVANSGGTVVLSWTAASGSPTTYIVEAGSAPGGSNLANSDLGGTATSLTATGVGAGTYYVRIRAKNACGTSSPSNEVVLTVTAGGGALTGRWVGLSPDGLIISDPQSCDAEQDIQLDLTQSGTTLAGTFTSRTRALTGRGCGVIGFIASTAVTGTVSGSAVTLVVPQDRGLIATFALTVSGNRLSGSAVGYPATLAVTRQ